MKATKLFLVFLLSMQCVFGQSQKVTSEDVFRRYLATENESMAKMVANSGDSIYSIFCKALFENNEEEAISLYSIFIQKNPKYGLGEAYFNRGIQYHSLGKTEIAILNFNKAIQLNIQNAYLYYFRGASYASLEEYENAISDYSSAIEIDNKFDLAYLMRGNSLFDQKKYANALKDYDKAIKLNKMSDQAYLMRGLVYEAMGEYQKALADWEEVKKINVDNSENADKLIKQLDKKMKEMK